ncbi:MAG TPA: hypothetical protein V6D20_18740 [Candidatus Obscuribacterales bacterium]
MTNSSLPQAPPRADNNARNLLIVILPSLFTLFCILALLLREVAVSRTFSSSDKTFWTQVLHGSGSSDLCSPLTRLD